MVFKTENGVIDEKNNYVYSFYDEGDDRESYTNLNLDNYIGIENGNIKFQKNQDCETYSTGAKVLIKDKNNKLMKSYNVIIFGDINGGGCIDNLDSGMIKDYIFKGNTAVQTLTKAQILASDMNNDGKVANDDSTMASEYDAAICQYNQITRICTDYS